MKRILGIGVTAAAGIAVALLLLNVGGSPTANAATFGVGGTISFGTVTGDGAGPHRVTVNTTAATDPYKGFNIHVTTSSAGGAGVTNITGNANGSTLDTTGDPADIFCSSSPAAPTTQKVVACTALAGQSTTAAGLLATLTVTATGNGCVTLQLIQLPAADPSFATQSTYTINTTPNGSQANVVSSTTVNMLIGTGTIADCGGIATATPTDTPAATDTALPTGTSTATPTSTPCPPVGCPSITPSLTPLAPITGTLTPTGTPPTSTPAATNTPAPPAAVPTQPAGTTDGQQPGAGTGGRTGIRLPDTGSGGDADSAMPLAAWLLVASALIMGTSMLTLAARRRADGE